MSRAPSGRSTYPGPGALYFQIIFIFSNIPTVSEPGARPDANHNTMTSFIKHIAILAIIFLTGACTSSSPEADDMPASVTSFITTYFPSSAIESASSTSGGGWLVTIKDGAQLTFDASDDWTDINGRGETLPQMLLTDQLPSKVTDYLTEMELLDGVYRLTRSWHELKVELQDSYFTYNSQTGDLTYPSLR